MPLVKIGNSKPHLSQGSNLQGTASGREPASDKMNKAFIDNIQSVKTLEELSFILRFFSNEGYGIKYYSQDRVMHLGILAMRVDAVDKSVKDYPKNVVFMWNLFTRSGGLRKRVMELAGCDEDLIASFH